MILEFAKIFIELVKGVAWPIAALIVAFKFRPQIVSLLPRLRKASLSGLELDAESLQASKPPEISQPLPSLQISNPALQEQENRILADLSFVEVDKKIPVLVRRLAVAQFASYFENTYGLIFGSQIEFLQKLQSTELMSKEVAMTIYTNTFLQRYQLSESNQYSFANWAGFITSRKLVDVVDSDFRITELGKEFLLYLQGQGHTIKKAL